MPLQATFLATRGDLICVDEVQHATTMLLYVASEGRLRVLARSLHKTDTTAAQLLDDDHCIRADSSYNVLISRSNFVPDQHKANGLEVLRMFHLRSLANR
jgi:hypothetical protein